MSTSSRVPTALGGALWPSLAGGIAFAAILAQEIPVGVLGGLGLVGVMLALLRHRGWMVALVLVLMGIASTHAAREHARYAAAPMGPFAGVATLRSDPEPRGRGVAVVLELDGHRYRTQSWGRVATALGRRLSGERVVVTGERVPMPERMRSWARSRHVVGAFEPTAVVGENPGSVLYRAANRVHRALDAVADDWDPDERALLAGLVLGNDKSLDPSIRAAFRDSGLAHLTAASGQNLALLTGVVAPVLARRRRRTAILGTWILIGWFATLTRFEPSVLRAGTMAAITVAFTRAGTDDLEDLGAGPLARSRHRLGPLAATVAILVLIDPLIVGSVSLWLSVTATAGLALGAGPLTTWLNGSDTAMRRSRHQQSTPGYGARVGSGDARAWCARAVSRAVRGLVAVFAVTLAAQLGVLAVSTIVFGLPSSVSLLANVAAVPVAGAIMLCGPVLVVAGATGEGPMAVVAWACRHGVQWLVLVAQTASRWRPPMIVDLLVWTLAIVAMVIAKRRARRNSQRPLDVG